MGEGSKGQDKSRTVHSDKSDPPEQIQETLVAVASPPAAGHEPATPDATDAPDTIDKTLVSPGPAGPGGGQETLSAAGGLDATRISAPESGTVPATEAMTEGVSSPTVTSTVPLERAAAKRSGAGSPGATESPSELFAGRFEVVRILGEGGMGKVYLVRDQQIENRKVALKVLRPRFSRNARFRELFFKEIHAASRFVSEHVVQIRDTGQMDDGKLFMTMDYVSGEDLRHLLRREKMLSERHALGITRQMLLGLQSGHEQGFVHRDVKPGNVMMAARVPKTEDNPFGLGVRMLDFGIAGIAADMEEGQTAGTPTYMSPEQAQGHKLDPRSDLFAVGLVLFEMLTGKRALEGETQEEVIESVIETSLAPAVDSVEGLSKPARRILKRALQKERDKRFQSAAEFIDAIENSRSFREIGETSPAGWVMAALMTGLALGAAYMWREAQRVVDANAVRIAGLESSFAHERNQLTDERKRRVKAEQERDELQAKVKGQEGAEVIIDEVKADTDENRDIIIQQLSRDVETANDKIALLLEENADHEQLWREAERDRQKLANELRELKTGQAQAALEDTKAGQQHELFVRIFNFFDEPGQRRAALHEFEERDRAYLFTSASAGDTVFLDGILNAGVALDDINEEVERGGRFPMALLEEAEEAFAKVSLEGFESAARNQEWLGFDATREGGEEPYYEKDMARARAAHETVRAELEQARSAMLASRQSERDVIRNGPADQDPEAARAFASAHDEPAVLQDLLTRYVEKLAGLESGGKLDIEALEAETVLAAWGGICLDESLDLGSAGSSLLDYVYARRWWVEGATELRAAQPNFLLPAPDISESSPESNWRALLALQYNLYRLLEDGTFAVLHEGPNHWFLDPSSGDWERERLEAEDGKQDSWRRVTHYYPLEDRDAPPPSRSPAVRRKKDKLVFAATALDLRDPDLLVGGWSPLSADERKELPARTGLPDTDDIEEFWASEGSGPFPCVVHLHGDVQRWFSPNFGMVRERETGVWQREFAYSD